MMFARNCLLSLACALLVASSTSSADDKKVAEDAAEITVRLKLNAIENSMLLDHYEMLAKRELSLHDSVRACLKSGDNRLPQYQQALQESQDDLDTTKKKLVALEAERKKLITQLGTKDLRAALTERVERADRNLAKILDHLNSLEKRLEKLERGR